jgi:steroid Delta-isomerase
VAPNEVQFTIAAVHPAGDEAAVIASVSTRLPNRAVVNYDGVFVYRTDHDGRIVSLRGYWDIPHLLAALSA